MAVTAGSSLVRNAYSWRPRKSYRLCIDALYNLRDAMHPIVCLQGSGAA